MERHHRPQVSILEGTKIKKKKTLKITHLFRQVVEGQLKSAIGSDNHYNFKPHKFKLVLCSG